MPAFKLSLRGGRFAWVSLGLVVLVLLVGVEGATLLIAQTRVPPEKQVFFDREERQLQESRTRALTQPTAPISAIMTEVALTPVPTSPPSTGIRRRPAGAGTIVENGGGPFASQATRIFNHWYYQNPEGYTVGVWAGGDGQNRLQGLVVVSKYLDNKVIPGAGGRYLTPRASGPVRVVDATGAVLTLRSDSGDTFVFDVESRRFVGS